MNSKSTIETAPGMISISTSLSDDSQSQIYTPRSNGTAEATLGSLFDKDHHCSPPKASFDVTVSVLKGYLDQHGITFNSFTPSQQRALAYMYGKGLAEESEDAFQRDAKKRNEPKNDEKLKKAQINFVKEELMLGINPKSEVGKRLAAIMEKEGDIFSETIPDSVQHYNQFLAACPSSGWNEKFRPPDKRECMGLSPRSKLPIPCSLVLRLFSVFTRCGKKNKLIVNLLDENIDDQIKLIPFYRVQHSGLCYLHASVMLKYYLVGTRYPNVGKQMINIAVYIRQNFSSPELYVHVFGKSGGSSTDMLKKLLATNDSGIITLANSYLQDESQWKQRFKDIMLLLEDYGPGLVSSFMVTNTFKDVSISSHQGPIPDINEDSKGCKHAMIVVGARLDNQNNGWFLLQNWWSKKQFVEVDFKWLKSSGASLSFVAAMGNPTENLTGDPTQTGQVSQIRSGGGYAELSPTNYAHTNEGFERSDGGVPKETSYPFED